MSISAVNTYYQQDVVVGGGQGPAEALLTISGLTAGSANTVPHGLPRAPRAVVLVPGANGLWGETQNADATNIYITVGGGGATGGKAYVQY